MDAIGRCEGGRKFCFELRRAAKTVRLKNRHQSAGSDATAHAAK
jgi:hypothetical protein